MGMPPEVGEEGAIERELANMEYALRKEKASNLYESFDIGFQVIEVDDDEQRAIGIRVFRTARDWLYAPIFFIHGKLKGDELLLVKTKDMFVPFEDEWVNYLLSKEPLMLGESFTEDVEGTEPDFKALTETPMTQDTIGGTVKGASIEVGGRTITLRREQPAFLFDMDFSRPRVKEALMEADEGAKRGFREFLHAAPKVAEYYANEIPNLLDLIKPKQEGLFDPAPPADAPPVKVATMTDEVVSPQEKSVIITQGYSVRDKRERAAQSQLVDVSADNYVTPAESGFYSIVTKGKPLDALVVIKRRRSAKRVGNDGGNIDVIDWKDKTHDQIDPKNLCAVDNPDTGQWARRYEDLSGRVEYTSGSMYFFMGPKSGAALGPFSIWDVTKLPNGQVLLHAGTDILITQSSGEPTELDGRIIMPRTWKAFKVKPGKIETQGADETLLAQGLPLQVKKAQKGLLIRSEGSRDHVRNAGEAMKVLIEKYAFSEPDAKHILHDAQEIGRTAFFYKEAAISGAPGVPGASMPGMPIAQMGAPGQPPVPATQAAAGMAQEALMRGQFDAVDTAAIGTLLATSDAAQTIKKFIPDIISSVDRWGRTLFLIYWNWDEFSESWGARDLEEMVDDLVSVFKTSGKLVLRLKESLAGPAELPIFG